MLGDAARTSVPTEILDEIEGYELLSELGISHAAACAVAIDGGRPNPALFPAAVKILGRNIAHKTELGGVVLGVTSVGDFEAAAKRIRQSVTQRAPHLAADRVVVQRMAEGAIGEVLLGYRVDAQVGALILVAAGGTLTELLRDRSIRMAPVDIDEARAMLSELRSSPLLTGFRGRPSGDIDALAKAIAALSTLAARPDVEEVEINPLMIMPKGKGVLAVDVVARVQGAR